MMKASFVVAVPLALGLVVAAASIASAQTDPHVGTWKLNLAKSKFNPGPPPQSETISYEADGPNLTNLVQGIDADGRPMNPDRNKVVINFDGKDHPTPRPNYDTSAWKRIDVNGFEITRKRIGKVVQTTTNIVSKDEKTMTITTNGTNAKGEKVNNVEAFDKQ